MSLKRTSSFTMTVEKNDCGELCRTSSLIKFTQDNDGSQLISSSTVSQVASNTWTPVVGQQYEESVITGVGYATNAGTNINNNVVMYNQSGQMASNTADVYGLSGVSHVPQTIVTSSVVANGGPNINNNGAYYSQSGQNANSTGDVFGSGIINSGGMPLVPQVVVAAVLQGAYFSNGGQQANNGGNLAAIGVNQNNSAMQHYLVFPPTVGGTGAPNNSAISATGNSLQRANNVGQNMNNRGAMAVHWSEYAENAENSVGSTISPAEDGPIVEDPDEPTDLTTEPMAFLQGLNSGNLMQFSQQSVLREMMLQDLQSQSNSLPKLENHNIGGYNFSMVLKEPPKSHWVYSDIMNRLYIRMDKTFNVDVQFKAVMPIQPLNLRVFLCFNKDVSGAVVRCQNHLSTEPVTTENSKMRDSLLRCENPSTTYCGSAQGKGISERYSVLVPLNLTRSGSRNGGFIRQTLAFKFVCQNSCLGRKETSLIFCLETASGDILAQNFIGVKICTCPKRDCTQDVRHFRTGNERKRKSVAPSDDEDDNDVKPSKLRRRTVSYNESNDSRDMAPLPIDWQVSRTHDGQYKLEMTCPNKEWMLDNIDGMIRETAFQAMQSPTKNKRRQQFAKNLVNLKQRAFQLP